MKAILIIDMPNNCYECPLEYDRKCLGLESWKQVESLDRPKWCPLKKMNFLKMSYNGYVFYNRQWLKDHIEMETSIIKGERNDHQERSKRV